VRPKPDTRASDTILLAIAKEKASYVHLAAAARACRNPQGRRLYNQLALDELRHLLTLVSLLDGLAEDCLGRLDLTLPSEDLPDPLPETEEELRRSAMDAEAGKAALYRELAAGVDRQELAALLAMLEGEERDHLARLRSLEYGVEAGRPAVAKWLRSIRRLAPAAYLH